MVHSNLVFILVDKNKGTVFALKSTENAELPQYHKSVRKDLPTYSMAEVGIHVSR